ncbi:DUF177 domain-containing protein [Pseudooctadecabacter sp.]|uniref:YceD family protein n=1 Tax=Pseudooctadecabacter sp. TaxID=1966338 RepID=UPI0035C87D4C
MSDRPRHIVRLSDLPSRKRTPIQIEPDAAGRAELAEALDVLTIRKLRLEGELIPMGKTDWRLEATLGATVQQACVVTLEPVTTRIDDDVLRTYSANFEDPDAAEVEMPEDDTTEPLPETLDLVAVMAEALALSLPPFPRKNGAEIGSVQYTEPGKAAMTDEDARPFAGLAALRDSLENKDDDVS